MKTILNWQTSEKLHEWKERGEGMKDNSEQEE